MRIKRSPSTQMSVHLARDVLHCCNCSSKPAAPFSGTWRQAHLIGLSEDPATARLVALSLDNKNG